MKDSPSGTDKSMVIAGTSGGGGHDDELRTLMEETVTAGDLAQLRSQVLRLAALAGLSTQRAQRFVMAVNEAVSNAIKHAGGRGEVAVVQDDQRRLIAEVRDAGPGLPSAIRITLPAPQATGGRGMWLAEKLADHIDVHTNQRGTTVRLEMDLQEP